MHPTFSPVLAIASTRWSLAQLLGAVARMLPPCLARLSMRDVIVVVFPVPGGPMTKVILSFKLEATAIFCEKSNPWSVIASGISIDLFENHIKNTTKRVMMFQLPIHCRIRAILNDVENLCHVVKLLDCFLYPG